MFMGFRPARLDTVWCHYVYSYYVQALLSSSAFRWPGHHNGLQDKRLVLE